MTTTYTFKLCDGVTGNPTAFLPQFTDASVSWEMSDVGSLAFKYPKTGINFSMLGVSAPLEIALYQNGVEMDDGRFRLQSLSDDEIDSSASVDFTGISIVSLLDRAKVYSANGSVTQGIDQTFTSVTPGAILKTLFDQNKARGLNRVMDRITYATFSNTTDSNGNAWAYSLNSITYTVGVSYLDVMRNLFENGMIEFKMVGRDLRVYNAGTMGSDKTVVAEPVVLRRGRDLIEAPRTSTNEQVAGIVLVVGDNNVLAQYTDTSVTALWGEDEAFLSQGGIADSTTLGTLSAQEVQRRSSVRTENTHKISLSSSPWTPYVDYKTSDYIYSDRGLGVTRLRVRQIVLDIEANNTASASIVLNDKFLEQEIAISRRVNGILGGSSALGSVAVPTDPAEPAVDTTIPGQVTSLAWSSAAYQDSYGGTNAQITASWAAVTQNTDSSVFSDFDHYETQSKRNSTSDWGNQGIVNSDTTTSYMASPPNTIIDVRVRAVDSNGHKGAWSTTVTHTTASDTTAPPTPSAPVTSPYLGQIRVYWDGLGSAAETMPADFMYTELHMSTTNAFTPSSSTLVDQMEARGFSVQTDLTYGTTYYFKFISVDQVGNKSSASAQTSGVPESVTGLDIAALTIATANMADLAISTAKIADASILNAKIANLAVDNAKIASVSVGKLTAGSLSADMTVSARIKTADTGSRVELNSSGLQAYKSTGQKTVDIAAATGAATFTGTFKTGFTTDAFPYLGISDGSDRSTIDFWNSTSTLSAEIASVVETDGTVGLIQRSSPMTYFSTVSARHTMWFAGNSGIYLETWKSDGAQDHLGYGLNLGENDATIKRFTTANLQTGGDLWLSSNYWQISRQSAGTAIGGKIWGDNLIASMDALNSSGALLSRVQTYQNKIFMSGAFPDSDPDSGKAAIYAGSWTINANAIGTWTYGATMAGNLLLNLSCFKAAASAYDLHLYDGNNVQFRIWGSNSTATFTWWGFRVV